ncbi:unnamed protein product [Symbiodinium sp. CCMP2592]|nr:unnamed protein product [Symbiodinium sp. CCMP2592]
MCYLAAPVSNSPKRSQATRLLGKLHAFGLRGAAAVRQAAAKQGSGSNWEDQWIKWNSLMEVGHDLWASAFHLMESLLQGVLVHQGDVIQGAEVQEDNLCFKDFVAKPLVVEVFGLDFPPLPGAVELREDIVSKLGDKFDRAGAFQCWEERKEEFPLESSKLRRVHESLAQYYLPQFAAEKAFWGYLNAPPGGCCLLGSLQFQVEEEESRRNGQTICQAQLAIIDELCVEVLLQDRFLGERFAPSSMNFLAMTHGHAAGQKGADPKKIAKLLSAAETWGPGDSGWTQFDETWTCTDEKDWWGRTIREQGRARAKRMARNAEVVSLRQQMDELKRQEAAQKRVALEQEQLERAAALEKAMEKLKVEAPRDPARLHKAPARLSAEAYLDPMVCVTRGPHAGFDERSLMADARYKLSAALQAAGLYGTRAGHEALARVAAPRPAQPHIVSQVFNGGYPTG